MNRNVRITVVLFLTLVAAGHSQSSRKPSGATTDALQKCLREYRKEYSIPGIAAVVLTSERILDIGVDGVRKLGEPDSIEIDDKFHIGSNTKAMTGFVAGVLVGKGLIGWDTRISDVFPEFVETTRDVYKDKTLQDLLSHRARIRKFMSGSEFAQLPEFQGSYVEQRMAFAGWLLQQEPVDIDTTRGYTYSNAGYAIAAAMLEKVSGKSWEKLMQKELFEPLEIAAAFGWPAYADEDQPWGHYYDADSERVVPHDPRDEYQLPKIASAAGDVSVSIKDYAKFLSINLFGLNSKDTILETATYRYLHTCNDSTKQYAIGWGRRQHEGYAVSRHNGSAGTFYCTAIVFRDKDLALAVMMNGDAPEAVKGIAELRERILKTYLE
ncbi:MAG: beta-lactamase family protein [candidate division WOR-3 bacterium]|nr:MAG: beta-lactamase family protein [candidate division WOR-3 bacterium]